MVIGYDLYSLLLVLFVILITSYAVISEKGFPPMGSPADLKKLVDNLKRASAITDRAAADATKHATIMDSFEKRLDLNNENMSKIAEYEKMMAEMDTMGGNGGPALDATFSSTSENTAGAGDVPVTSHSTKGGGMFTHSSS